MALGAGLQAAWLRRTGAALACVLAATAVPAEPLPATVRIATEGANPPFNYVENGQPAGFEVELGEALCAAAHLTCRFVLHEWEGIIKGLEAREYDAIMASLTITPKRRARIAFSRLYYRIPLSYVARRNMAVAAVTPEAIKGLAIGAAENTPAAAYLETHHDAEATRLFASVADAVLDLVAGRLDLVLGSKFDLSNVLGKPQGDSCCRFVGDVPGTDPESGEGVGAGLRRDDAALREAFDAAIAAVIADGSYDRIRAKYLPFETK